MTQKRHTVEGEAARNGMLLYSIKPASKPNRRAGENRQPPWHSGELSTLEKSARFAPKPSAGQRRRAPPGAEAAMRGWRSGRKAGALSPQGFSGTARGTRSGSSPPAPAIVGANCAHDVSGVSLLTGAENFVSLRCSSSQNRTRFAGLRFCQGRNKSRSFNRLLQNSLDFFEIRVFL